ncbi:Helix-turn-helix domain-containing protein (plasmid) [Rhodovastum atsumiense]|uniref:helix-turn-helix domain-containing protein n=1 Tax=Rhodovastum atsumiense TaxID=504468 RepID=UPI0020248775|nr:helix-turn-helix domain-containing protein [Rhodovastum atsumiense]CAH2605770.1 Helix-turn-helix domain-containing protein [Rhodovastum atsumiense]
MPRFRPPSPEEIRERRRALHEDIEAGGLPVADAVRRMREALGMTQADFARAFRLTERQVWEIEAGKANPTLATLNRIGKPFGFQAGLVLLHPRRHDSTG